MEKNVKEHVLQSIRLLDEKIAEHEPDLIDAKNKVLQLEQVQIKAINRQNELIQVINGFMKLRDSYTAFLEKYEAIEAEYAKDDETPSDGPETATDEDKIENP